MANYLVTFTPLEPYFFGNERVFDYGKIKSTAYFIKSESLPLQSTILGTIRYCCIKNPTMDFQYKPNIIGKKSFNIMEEEQDFGCIKSLSPIFLVKENEYLIRTPYNHKNGEKTQYYTPFQDYYQPIETCEGKKRFPKDYNPKEGIADTFTSIVTGVNYDLIHTTEQVGIRKNTQENGFFKKQYVYLQSNDNVLQKNNEKTFDISFAVMAEIELNLDGMIKIVYMGQGKTAFVVKFQEKENNFTKKIITFWEKKNKNYPMKMALSDIYIKEPITKLNELCYYVNVKLRDYRSFLTNYQANSFHTRYEKGKVLQHLIRAGSVFWIKENKEEEFEKMLDNKNCKKIGFNKVI